MEEDPLYDEAAAAVLGGTVGWIWFTHNTQHQPQQA